MAKKIETVYWGPSREHALLALQNFIPRAGKAYRKWRNYDLGSQKNIHVSKLSPWLRYRVISEEEIIKAVLSAQTFSNSEKFIQEIFWRTYWKGWLESHPSAWSVYREKVRQLLENLDSHESLRERWEKATTGNTNIECFNSWARELVDTGYLHNHARMWFASIWVFELNLPWVAGADFFLRHLLDGDPASNTLSWRWTAGLHTKGKKYIATAANIEKFTNGRFPVSENPLKKVSINYDIAEYQTPALQPLPRSGKIDQDQPLGLIITEEDLSPNFLGALEGKITGIIAIQIINHLSPLKTAKVVSDFSNKLLLDAIARVQENLKISKTPVLKCGTVDEIVNWACDCGYKQLVSSYIPVGPNQEFVLKLKKQLISQNIELIEILRTWDINAWPDAKNGFFPFWAKAPRLLQAL